MWCERLNCHMTRHFLWRTRHWPHLTTQLSSLVTRRQSKRSFFQAFRYHKTTYYFATQLDLEDLIWTWSGHNESPAPKASVVFCLAMTGLGVCLGSTKCTGLHRHLSWCCRSCFLMSENVGCSGYRSVQLFLSTVTASSLEHRRRRTDLKAQNHLRIIFDLWWSLMIFDDLWWSIDVNVIYIYTM